MEETIKCLIIGSGPAGYTAAIYTSRANLQPVLYEGIEPGGQLTTTTDVENFPGYPDGVSGQQMMADMRRQAERFGTEIRTGTATRVDLASRPFHVVIDGEKEIRAESLIIATGASARYLGLPSETKFRGMGVSACATCDGFFYRKKDVAVVGGGDTACEEATYLASICRKVYMIVRKPHLRASKAMQQRVFSTPNIEVIFNHNTAEVLGDDRAVTDAGDAHPAAEGEEPRTADMDDVLQNGDPHGDAGVLHPDEPAVEAEEHDARRYGPDAGVEVFGDQFVAVHGPDRRLAERVLQQQDQCAQYGRDEQRARQRSGAFAVVLRAVGLRRQSARAHAQEGAVPVDEVEDRNADGQRSDRARGVAAAQIAGDHRAGDAHDGDGNVGNDVRKREPQDFPIHKRGV